VLWWSCHGWSCHRHGWWCCLGHGHRRRCCHGDGWRHNSRCLRGCCRRDGNDLERFAHHWCLTLLQPGTDEQDRNSTQGHEDGCSNQADLLPRRALPNRPVLRLVMRPCRRTHLGVTVLLIVQDRIDDLGLVPTGTVLRPHARLFPEGLHQLSVRVQNPVTRRFWTSFHQPRIVGHVEADCKQCGSQYGQPAAGPGCLGNVRGGGGWPARLARRSQELPLLPRPRRAVLG
jgi:hypothetical protein